MIETNNYKHHLSRGQLLIYVISILVTGRFKIQIGDDINQDMRIISKK